MKLPYRADEHQVGGNHYTKLGLQPLHFTLANGWDGASHAILKYISRHHSLEREKAIESLRKAMHIVDLVELAKLERRYINTALLVDEGMQIELHEYFRANTGQFGDIEREAMIYLGHWLYGYEIEGAPEITATMLKNKIEDILTQRYGVSA